MNIKMLAPSLFFGVVALLSGVTFSQGSNIDINQAISTALERYPGTSVIEAELERESGVGVWEIELSNGAEVYVDAASGDVIGFEARNVSGDETMSGSSGTDINQAIAIAKDRYEDASVIEIEYEDEDGRTFWEIELSNGAEVEIDIVSGSVVKLEPEDSADRRHIAPNSFSVSIEQAIAIATDQYPNSSVSEVELERTSRGTLVWEVELSNDVEIEIDASSGNIIEIDQD